VVRRSPSGFLNPVSKWQRKIVPRVTLWQFPSPWNALRYRLRRCCCVPGANGADDAGQLQARWTTIVGGSCRWLCEVEAGRVMGSAEMQPREVLTGFDFS
jgi:hypothetical protein